MGEIAPCLPGEAVATESEAEGVADIAAESDDPDAEMGASVEDKESPEDTAAELEGGGVTTEEAAPSVAEGVDEIP